MATFNEKSLKNEIIDRFAEPVKYKLKFYHFALIMFLDQVLANIASKYMFIRVVIEENAPKSVDSESKLDALGNKIRRKFLELIQIIKLKFSETFSKKH